jgi:hypothetical protein
MVTCYEDYDSRWKGESVSMINNNTFPVFKEWAIDMLRQWSQNDPVSDKERARNNAVFALQGNRNPYIDYPELIDCIWDEGETAFTLPVLATTPVLFSPTAESELKWGTKEKSNYSTNKEIFIKGTLLTQPVTISTASGSTTRFSFSPSIVTAEEANAGFHLTVTFKPTAVGEFNEILKVTGAETGTVEVPLSGTVIEKLPTPLPVFPTDDHDVVLFYNNSWLSNFPDNFQTNITISGNTYNYSYSSHYDTLLGFKASNTYLQIEYEREAEFLQFSLRSSNAWSDKDNHILVYESADGSNWGEAIYDVDNSFGTIADDQNYNNTPEIPLSQDSRFLKIVYQKEAQNVMLNNILLANTKEQNMMTPVSGNIMVYAHNGILYTRNLPAGTPLYVYSLQGKLLQTVIPRSACETLCLPSKGLFIVKTGDKSFKIVN